MSGFSAQLYSDNGNDDTIYREYFVDETMQKIAWIRHFMSGKTTCINGCVRVRSKKTSRLFLSIVWRLCMKFCGHSSYVCYAFKESFLKTDPNVGPYHVLLYLYSSSIYSYSLINVLSFFWSTFYCKVNNLSVSHISDWNF